MSEALDFPLDTYRALPAWAKARGRMDEQILPLPFRGVRVKAVTFPYA